MSQSKNTETFILRTIERENKDKGPFDTRATYEFPTKKQARHAARRNIRRGYVSTAEIVSSNAPNTVLISYKAADNDKGFVSSSAARRTSARVVSREKIS